MMRKMHVRGPFVLTALVAALISCSDASPSGSPAPVDPPDVARIRCGADAATDVETPVVQAQADGVHIRVRVPPGADLAFIVGGVGGDDAEAGPFVFAVPPGEMKVACLDPYRQDPGDDSLYRTVEIVDQEGVYVDASMSCAAEGVSISHAGGSRGQEPVEAARNSLRGLRPGDDLASVGYVARQTEASVAVLRDGVVIAVVELEPVQGGWAWKGFSGCPGSGVSSS
jgi:hypothetical protein